MQIILKVADADCNLSGNELTSFTLKSCLFLCRLGMVNTEKINPTLKYRVFSSWVLNYHLFIKSFNNGTKN